MKHVLDQRFPKWGWWKILGGSQIVHKKKYYKMKYLGAPAPKPLTVTDFWPCDLIIYWFYSTAKICEVVMTDVGRQCCFLAGLKSVMDKDEGEILVSS